MPSLPPAFELTPEVDGNAHTVRLYALRLAAKTCHLRTYINAPYSRLCFVIFTPISVLVIVITLITFCLYDIMCTQSHANAHTHVHIPDQHNDTVSPIYKGGLV